MPNQPSTPSLNKEDNKASQVSSTVKAAPHQMGRPTVPPTSPDTSTTNYPELSATPADQNFLKIAGLIAVITLLLLIGFGVFLFLNPAIATILRDIVIVFFGVGVVFVTILLAALIAVTVYIGLKLNDLIRLLDREIKPMLKNLQDTLVNVRGTTSFISDNAVQPVIETVSMVSATRSIFMSLFRRK